MMLQGSGSEEWRDHVGERLGQIEGAYGHLAT